MTAPYTLLIAPDGTTITSCSPAEITRLRMRGYTTRPIANAIGPQLAQPAPVGHSTPDHIPDHSPDHIPDPPEATADADETDE